MNNDDHEILKALIEVSVEKAFLEMGAHELDLVISRLKENYNCQISDCLEHPEYLKQILFELFGNSYHDILKSIHKTLKKTNLEQPIVNFLAVLDDSS